MKACVSEYVYKCVCVDTCMHVCVCVHVNDVYLRQCVSSIIDKLHADREIKDHKMCVH